MAQWVKVLAVKPGDWSSSLKNPQWKENKFLKVALWPPSPPVTPTRTHITTAKHTEDLGSPSPPHTHQASLSSTNAVIILRPGFESTFLKGVCLGGGVRTVQSLEHRNGPPSILRKGAHDCHCFPFVLYELHST